MNTRNEQKADKYASKRADDKMRELVFRRSPFLKPLKSAWDEKLCDADLMRLCLHILIEHTKWLGEVAHVRSASKYDSFCRLIDIFTQFTHNAQVIPLGFEICLAQEESEINTQIRAVIEELRGGQEFAMKYFDSPSTGKQINVKMPKVLFAWTFAEARALLEVVDQGSAKADLERVLLSRWLRRIFIDRTIGQLEEYARAADFAKNVEFANMHTALRDVIQSLCDVIQSKLTPELGGYNEPRGSIRR